MHPGRFDFPPLEVYHSSANRSAAGVETRTIDGVRMPLTTSAKSVADAFTFRSRIDTEAPLDALKQALSSRASPPAELN